MTPVAQEWVPSSHGQVLVETTPPPPLSFYFISNILLVFLCGITFVLVVIATVKTTKLVWPQDKIIPFMLALLSLSLLGSFSFFLWSLLRIYQWPFPEH